MGKTIEVRWLFPCVMGLALVTALGAAPADALNDVPRQATWMTNGTVNAVVATATTIYIGGAFSYVGPISGGQTRHNIAALDANTGELTEWNPNASDYVYALAVSDNVVYVGGYFTRIGGQPRAHIAALDATTGLATDWNPTADGLVTTLAISDGTVYAGGRFTTIGGQPRNGIAALDAASGLATTWNPGTVASTSYVYALAVSSNVVYAAGYFSTLGGQTRNGIAALDPTTGLATAWNPTAVQTVGTNDIRAIAVSDETIYVGGGFVAIGGQPRHFLAALDANTGLATTWNPYPNDMVYALAVSEGVVYAGGAFSSIGGHSRNRLAALDATTATASDWDPNLDGEPPFYPGYVQALAISGGTVYAGGSFTSAGGETQRFLAQFDLLGDITRDGHVDAMDIQCVINLALGATTTGDADVNDDGDVNATDVQLVINAALGR